MVKIRLRTGGRSRIFPPPMPAHADHFRTIDFWVFDLDNTLYPATSGLFQPLFFTVIATLSCIRKTAIKFSSRPCRPRAGTRECTVGRYLKGVPIPALSTATRMGAESWSTGIFTELDTLGREAVLSAPTLIRGDRTPRGKCSGSSSSIRSHSSRVTISPFVALFGSTVCHGKLPLFGVKVDLVIS